MATILPPPTQGFNPLGFLVPAFQGLLQGQELGRERQDLQHLGNIQQLSNLSGQAPDLSGFQSQQFRGQAAQNMLQNLGLQNQPISPFQQEQLGIQRQVAGQLTPSAQTAQDKRTARLAIEEKLRRGEDVTEDVKNFKTLFGGGQEINIDLGRTSASERESIASGRAAVDALDNLRTLHDNPKTRSGMLVGRIDPLLGLVGATTDEQESFLAASSSFENQLIKEITGAQMSVQEADRIMREVPRPTDPPKRWRAKWEQSRNNRIRLAKRRIEVLRQSDIRVPEDVQKLASQKERPLSKAAQKELQPPSLDTIIPQADIDAMTPDEIRKLLGQESEVSSDTQSAPAPVRTGILATLPRHGKQIHSQLSKARKDRVRELFKDVDFNAWQSMSAKEKMNTFLSIVAQSKKPRAQ